MNRLLVVDDDRDLCLMLRDFLQDSGFLVETEPDGLRGSARAQSEYFNLVILDVMLSNANGFDVLRQIRRRSRLPIMMLTAKTGRTERVSGFELGADDYLSKPFYPDELLARVRAILRRSGPATGKSPESVRAGELVVIPGSRNAYYQGKDLNLTAMECDILEMLVRSCGRVVSRDQLSLQMYNRPVSAFDRTIDTHVSRIRRKLGTGRELIVSVRGTGYQLCDLPGTVRT